MEKEVSLPKIGDTVNECFIIVGINKENGAIYLLKKGENQKNFDTYCGDLEDQGNNKWTMHGEHGKYIWPSGASYEGNWVNGKKEGKGKYIYPDGASYEGNWVNGKKEGFGTYTWWPYDDKYEGNWKNGKMHGEGKYIKKTMIFEGKYIDDVPVYFTKITIKDENKKLHIITKDNDDKYYYQTGEEGEKTEIDMKNQKRLKEALLQLGTGKSIFQNEQEKFKYYRAQKEFETFIKDQIGSSKNNKEPIIKAIAIPGHAFTMLFENGKAYVYDIGGLDHNTLKEYSNVVKGNENIEYCKIESDLNLEFSLTNDKEISFKIDEDDHMCRHQALLIFQKLTELKTKPLGKEEGTLHDELMEYINSKGANGLKPNGMLRINSLGDVCLVKSDHNECCQLI